MPAVQATTVQTVLLAVWTACIDGLDAISAGMACLLRLLSTIRMSCRLH